MLEARFAKLKQTAQNNLEQLIAPLGQRHFAYLLQQGDYLEQIVFGELLVEQFSIVESQQADLIAQKIEQYCTVTTNLILTLQISTNNKIGIIRQNAMRQMLQDLKEISM